MEVQMTDKEMAVILIQRLDSTTDLRDIYKAYKDRYRDLDNEVRKEALQEFGVGDVVIFFDKWETVWEGTITKINRKTVTVDCNDRVWRVNPTMLTLASEATRLNMENI